MFETVNKYRKYSMLAIVFSAVSLFVGGTLLAVVGLIIAINAMRKMTAIAAEHPENEFAAKTLKLAKNAIILCGAAAVLNFVTMLTLAPALMAEMGLSMDAMSGAATSATGIF